MELRKLCCHPFLCDGVEEEVRVKHALRVREAGREGVPTCYFGFGLDRVSLPSQNGQPWSRCLWWLRPHSL
jgi:hypothetical protein